MVAVCDIAIADENAMFALSEVRLGLVPAVIGPYVLQKVGMGAARALFVTGERIGAAEAYRIGLVNEIVPNAELIPRSEAILKQIISNAPQGVKFSIEAVNKGLETSLTEGLLLEASLFAICAATEDKKEGTSAFLEKRAPQFRGR